LVAKGNICGEGFVVNWERLIQNSIYNIKFFPLLNLGLRHEGVCGNGGVTACVFNLGTWWM